MSAAGARLRARERLRTGAEFRRVFRRGVRLDGPLFQLVAARNELAFDRLGLAASRRVGNAVARNRAKRLLREAFRRQKRLAAERVDVVLVAKAEIVGRAQSEVNREYRERLRRFAGHRRAGSLRPRDPASD